MAAGSVRALFAEHATPDAELGNSITPVILTFDEEPNIERTLAQLRWAKRVIVVDSNSRDATVAICAKFENVSVFQRNFDNHKDQWTYATTQTRIDTPWVLALDADYLVCNAFIANLSEAIRKTDIAGWRCHFKYVVFGKTLRGTLYPPIIALFRNGKGRFVQDGHTQRLRVDGRISDFSGFIYHDDRKPLSRWFTSQARYAKLEADHLLAADRRALGLADKLRLMAWPAPILAGLYALFAKGCILDGRAGWYYALQRVLAETLLALEILDRRLRQMMKD